MGFRSDFEVARAGALAEASRVEEALDVLAAARRHNDAPSDQVSLLRCTVDVLCEAGRIADARRAAQLAARLRERVPDAARSRANALVHFCELALAATDACGDAARDLYEQLLAQRSTAGADPDAAEVLLAATCLYGMQTLADGSAERALALADEADALLARNGTADGRIASRALAFVSLANSRFPARLARSRERLRDAYRLARDNRLGRSSRFALYAALNDAVLRGDNDARSDVAAALAANASAARDRAVYIRAAVHWAMAQADLGRLTAALELIARCRNEIATTPADVVLSTLYGAELSRRAGDRADAHRKLAGVRAALQAPLHKDLLTVHQIVDGRLLESEGRNDLAAVTFDDAYDLASEIPSPFQMAIAAEGAYRTTRRRSRRDVAHDLWTILRPPNPSSERAHVRGSPFPDFAAGESAADPLTPRQRAVSELVRRGLTNVEIGHALRISPHTVAHHVHAILSRRGLSVRRQI